MRNRTEHILRLACLVLAVLVLAQFIRTIFHVTPFFGVRVPAVPTLETNSPPGLNPAPAANPQAATGTNVPGMPAAKVATQTGTNFSTNFAAIKSAGTNVILTNTAENTVTNVVKNISTNISTNMVRLAGTNHLTGTNHLAGTNVDLAATTNPSSGISHGKSHPMMMAGGMGFGGMPGMPGMMGMPGNLPPLPPDIQARVDKVVNSEIFAPVMHPLPMGLMGIAGDTAFLRTDSGQTGLVTNGGTLGDVKLLEIGINRVLVEQGGQKKELTIFDGFGSDSLLSQKDQSSK
jgi:hypothetical protein